MHAGKHSLISYAPAVSVHCSNELIPKLEVNMRFRLKKGVFVRRNKNEVLMWCPRSGAALDMEHIFPIVKGLTEEWREIGDILRDVSCKLNVSADVLKDDLISVLGEINSVGLGDFDDDFISCESARENVPCDAYCEEEKFSGSIAQRFCERCGSPFELHLDITDACNEKCVHCYVTKESRFLDYNIIEKVLNEFRDANGLTVYITGGECMLHPRFRDICRLCAHLNLNFVILSNLVLCDESVIDFFKTISPQFINVSLYSMNAEEHDKITQVRGSWEKTKKAILDCEKAGVHIRISTPLLKENKCALKKLECFAKEHNMHLIPIAEIVPQCDHGMKNMAHICTKQELVAAFRENRELLDEGRGSCSCELNGKVCDIGRYRVYLNARGYYYPCDSMNGYELANAGRETLIEVWKGERLNYLRGLRNCDFIKCRSCPDRSYCKVCLAHNFNATGKVMEVDPFKCEFTRAYKSVYGKDENCGG